MSVHRARARLRGALLLSIACPAAHTLGCAGSDGGSELNVQLGVSPTPALVGDARLIVLVAGPAGAPVESAAVTVRATLDGVPGEQTSATEAGSGRYVVEAFPFSRSGRWSLTVDVVTVDGRSTAVEREVLVTGRD